MTPAQAEAIREKGYMVYTPTMTIVQEFFNGTRPASRGLQLRRNAANEI